MTKPIERVYVTENNLEGPRQASGFDVNPERAERFREAIKGVTRVFVEEPRWVRAAEPPSDGREVLLRYRPHGPTSIVTKRLIAMYGSEGKWIAIDHDYRREYLSASCVVSWQELPAQPVGP